MGGVGVVVGVVEEVVVDAVCSAILWQLSPPVGRFRVHPVGRSRVFLLGSGAGRSLRSLPPAPPARALTLAGSSYAPSTPSGGSRPLRSGRGRAEQAARLRVGSAPENCLGGIPRCRPSGNPPFRAPFVPLGTAARCLRAPPLGGGVVRSLRSKRACGFTLPRAQGAGLAPHVPARGCVSAASAAGVASVGERGVCGGARVVRATAVKQPEPAPCAPASAARRRG